MSNRINSVCLISFLVCSLLLATASVKAQAPDRTKLIETIDKEGCAITDDGAVKICKSDYKYKNKTIEALTFRPLAGTKFPGLFFIPGYTGTAKTYLGLE